MAIKVDVQLGYVARIVSEAAHYSVRSFRVCVRPYTGV